LHAVFSTKNRQPSLAPTWREELFQVLGGLTNTLGCQSLVGGGVEDHIHTLFVLSRTATISDVMKTIKSSSSAWVNEKHSSKTPFHWQAGDAAFSVRQSSVESVRHYIERQAEHHATRSFQDEMREWFSRYQIDWDERYVWD
jgi:REP element-mobilizing transposase RayT